MGQVCGGFSSIGRYFFYTLIKMMDEKFCKYVSFIFSLPNFVLSNALH
jgi:hypothetical protein